MEDLIIKYLNNTLSGEERTSLDQWVAKSGRNRKVFENIVNHWNVSQGDVDEARKRTYQAIIRSDRSSGVIKKQKQLSGWSIVKYAAVIAFCVSASIYFLSLDLSESGASSVTEHNVLIKETDRGQMLSIVLPDGTIVKLNAQSSLSYPERFDGDTRVVELEGEAFFDVKRDEEKPFHIKTEQLNVEVLGTSFCVRTYADESNPMVAVQSGKVLVKETKGTKSVSLRQDQYAFLDDSALVFKDITKADLFFGWVNRKLVFQEESVQSVFEKVSRWFNVDFEISRDFTNTDEFTGSYDNPSIDKVMRSLSFAYGFNYEIKDRMVKIY